MATTASHQPTLLTRTGAGGPRRRGGRRAAALLVPFLLAASATACQPTTVAAPARPAPAEVGLWTSRAELMELPTSGPAWAHLVQEAQSDWGTPSLADNNAQHDTSTLAGALVSVRTGDAALATKTRAAIMAVTRTTSYARVLELSRNLPSYVIAANLIHLSPSDDARFRTFISALRTKPLDGHSGGTDLLSTALRSPNNWGAMARAAMVSIDLYLGDRSQLATLAATHRAWLGEAVSSQLRYSDTGWHATGRLAGINPRASKNAAGRYVGGVLPEDQRRTGEPSVRGMAPKGSYPWEALQGALVTGVLLDRAGLVDIDAGDQALRRAFVWLIDNNDNPPASDDLWQPWTLNAVSGTHFSAKLTKSPGKNMAWTDWVDGPAGR
ncbi:hypothetical protein BH10ACT1_BH10ACT1_36070 [soil metagenome]